MDDNPYGPPQTAELQPGTGQLRPHRGVMILVFGILGLIGCCIIFPIVAWIMGNGDLREMAAGRMDPEGRGLTQAGKICGIIAVILNVIGLLFLLLFFVLMGASATLSVR